LFSHNPDASSLVAAFASADFSRNESDWNQAVARTRGAGDLSIPEPDDQGNYDSAVLRALASGWHQFRSGDVSEVQFLGLLGRAHSRVDTMFKVQQQCVDEGLDDPENPITQALLTSLRRHREVFDKLSVAAELRDERLGGEALTDLQQVTNEMVKAYAWFQHLRAEVLRMPCPSCGAETRRDARKCAHCGQILQALPETQTRLLAIASEGTVAPAPAPVSTPNYLRIDQAFTLWQQQQIDDRSLAAEIELVSGNMLAHRKANADERQELAGLIPEEQGQMEWLLDAIDRALERNLEALRMMELYFTTGNSDHLRAGFERLGPATQELVQAYMVSQTLMGQSFEEGDGEFYEDEE
jgi:hypothetical protein